MALKVVKEITQPSHGADGSVAYAPGDQFPADRELPGDVRWRLAVVEVPDEPVKAAPARAAATKAAPAAKAAPAGK